MYPFEIHLTTQPLPPAELARFVAACTYLQAKPLVIELARGVATTQPMLSKVVRQPNLAAALAAAAVDADYLRAQLLPPTRLKIETPVAGRHLATAGFAPYFEWHGKVVYEHPDSLLALCLRHGAHLSANALTTSPGTRFVTLREYGAQAAFEARVAGLVAALPAHWPLLKQENECCLYDSNVALDAGWLS
ncbi:MAG: hypothetical protein ACRYFX_04835 [Janthinobacterium lividum]